MVRQVASLSDVERIKRRMGELARGEGLVPQWPPGERELSFKFASAAEQQRREHTPGQQRAPSGDGQGALLRVHMLHRVDPTMEDVMLHPRVLDGLECLVGPDVACLQSMAFFNPPGEGGQGWHQDAAYITTYPDTLVGSWLALDEADVSNGCLRVARGSHVEPIYPERLPDGSTRGNIVHAQGAFTDELTHVENTSHLDERLNTLSLVAKKYEEVPVELRPGDVCYFHSHLLHRSHPNSSECRSRRAFVGHYCNARSWVPWNGGSVHRPYVGEAANGHHLLARGATHLPFATRQFGGGMARM